MPADAPEATPSSTYSTPDTIPIFDFVIPLSPLEKILIEGINTTYFEPLIAEVDTSLVPSAQNSDDDQRERRKVGLEENPPSLGFEGLQIDPDDDVQTSIGQTFQRWEWASEVENTVVVSQTESEVEEFGSRFESFSDAMHFLKSWEYDALQARVELMMEYNTGIFERLAIREPAPKIRFVPLDNDSPWWGTLNVMELWMELEHMQRRFGGSPPKQPFEIWKFAKVFSLACRRPQNAKNVTVLLIRSTAFRRKFLIRKAPTKSIEPGDIQVEILDRQAWLSPPRTSGTLPDQDGSGVTIDDLRWLAEVRPIGDPRSYVEIIPWDELTPVSDAELCAAQIPTSLHHEENPPQKWMLWTPPSAHFFDSHHLYTDFEVYNYCVTHGCFFPGHAYRGAIVFALSPIEQTNFVEELRHFWKLWNDCALSVDPDGRLVLLETIPGRQLRARNKQLFDSSARRYFRNLIEDHDQQRGSDSQVQAILGGDYKPQYQGVLRPVQADQFVRVDPEPFAKGGNGAIYNAILRTPFAVLKTMERLGPEIHVVLKQIRPEVKGQEILKKILHEIDITSTVLEVNSPVCVDFLGICHLWVSPDWKVSTSDQSPHAQRQLFLVFQRATEGDLLDFLDRHLRGLDKKHGWMFIVAILSSIVGGLTALHHRGVVHGDLHPANILVTKDQFSTSINEVYHSMLVDFGQGKLIGDGYITSSSSGRFMVQLGPYIAPEVRAGKSKTFASDIYSLGRIGRKMVNVWRWIVSTASNGVETVDVVPQALKVILDRCLAGNPEERPRMDSKVWRPLDDLQTGIDAGTEIEWVRWVVDPKEAMEDRPITTDMGDLSQAMAALDDLELAMG